MLAVPEIHASGRANLGFGEVSYGVGGVALYELSELQEAQIGYSVDDSGSSLAGKGAGNWDHRWLVIGRETALGDPIFLSANPPHAVFTAVHGQGYWSETLVAPSIEQFWACLRVFREFAMDRGSLVEAEAHPPNDLEVRAYLEQLEHICNSEVLGDQSIMVSHNAHN